MNKQFFLCPERNPETGAYYGVNLSAIESFWFQKKTEGTEARMTVHFRDKSIELKGANAEWLLNAMNLSA